MKKEKITIFPYDTNFVDVLRATNIADKYEQIYLCTMKGWGYAGTNAGKVDNGKEIENLVIVDSFEECLEKSDIIVFVDNDNEIIKGKHIYPKMFDAAMRGKDIVDLQVNNVMRQDIKEICSQRNCKYSSYSWDANMIETYETTKHLGLYDTDVPVVVVLGETENTKKYLVERLLKHYIEKRGYNVALIGSKSFSSYLGDISFPNFMIADDEPSVKQVLMFNRFIKEIEQEKKPDLIIVGVPGGFLSCNSKLFGDFGILANKVLKAIVPDFLVVNVLYEKYYEFFFDELQAVLNGRYSVEADAFCISNYHIDWEKVEQVQPKRVPFLCFSEGTVSEEIEKCRTYTDVPIYKTMCEDELQELSEQVIHKLAKENKKMIFER